MASLKTRVIIAIVLLGLTATVSALSLYSPRMEHGSLKASHLPLQLGPWIGQEVAVEQYVKEILETDDVVQRNYTNPRTGNMPVQLAVVFSADNRRVAHPPEVCYRGAGWEVMEKKIVQFEGLPPLVRLILAAGAGHKDMVFYCYKAGPQITANYYRQQYNIALNQIQMRATSSALIRFSTPFSETDDATQQKLLGFIRLMMPEIEKTLTD